MSTASRWLLLLPLLVAALMLGPSPAAQAGPGRPDPKQMSGIPRADPQIPAGEITVRVLDGGWDSPVLDATVELHLRSADGRRVEVREAITQNQGRAYFRELEGFEGGQAVARVVLGDQSIRSTEIDIRPEVGSAVMLVKGAPQRRGLSAELSIGVPFEFDKAAPGELMVGVFDLEKTEGLQGVKVQLHITPPGAQTEVREATTEGAGQTTFDGLGQLPPETTYQVVASLDDGEPYRSTVFPLDTSKGQGVVLARGRKPQTPPPDPQQGAHGQGQGPPGQVRRQPLPPPQIDDGLPVGTVQVLLVDRNDEPVADQLVTIVKKDFAGTEQRFSAKTNERGLATKAELPVVNDALYYVGVKFDGAPYTSHFFGLDKRGGVRVAMRVWPVTSDRAVVRSAIQFEVIEGENDTAQVLQVYEVLVGGDEAYWPGEEGLRIEGLPDAKGMVVLRGAEDWLDHEEKAPFATLAHPIPPGEITPLSVGYVLDGHDGRVDIDWTPPFAVVESGLIISEDVDLEAPGAKVSDRELPSRPGLDYDQVPYELGQQGTGPIRATLTGLRQTDKTFRWIGLAVTSLIGLVVVVLLATSKRGDAGSRLRRRRDDLLAALERSRDPRQRRRLVIALDRVYRQLEALDKIAERGRDRGRPAARS